MAGKRYEVGQAVFPIVAEIGSLKKDLDAAKAQISQFAGMGKAAGALLKGGLYGVAAAAALKFAKDSLAAYAQVQRATLRLEATAMRYGATVDGLSGSVNNYLEAIGRTTRFQDTEAADSVNNLIRYTKDLTVAFELNNAAMDLAESTGMSLGEASGLLGQAFTGSERGLISLAKTLGVTGDAAKSAEGLFNELDKRTKGAATSTTDLEGEWTKLKGVLDGTAKEFWTSTAPFLTNLAKLTREAADAAAGRDSDTTTQGRKQKEINQILDQRTKAMDKLAVAEKELGQIYTTDRAELTAEQDKKNISRLSALREETLGLTGDIERLDEAYRKLGGAPQAGGGLGSAAGKNQAALVAAEAAKTAQEDELKLWEQSLELRRQAYEAMEIDAQSVLETLGAFQELQAAGDDITQQQVENAQRLNDTIKALGGTMASVQANEMQAFFTAMKEGTVEGAQWYEALGKAMLKSAVSAFGDVLIQEAAVYNYRALAAALSLNFPAAGSNLLAAGALASAGGGFKAIAAGLNKGGYAISGSATEDTIPAMIKKGEAVVPLQDPRAMEAIGSAMAAAGGRSNSLTLNFNGVRDAADASNRLARDGARMLQDLDKAERRQGRRPAIGG